MRESILQHHFYNHATKGLGENPTSCPLCAERLSALEVRMNQRNIDLITHIILPVGVSVLAAYLINILVPR